MLSSWINDPFMDIDPWFGNQWHGGMGVLDPFRHQRNLLGGPTGQQQLGQQGQRGQELTPFSDTSRRADDMRLLSFDRLMNEPLSLEVNEKDKEFELIARAPQGIRKKDLHVDVTGNYLTISGERVKKHVKKTGQREEYVSFSRSMQLPDTVDLEHIVAKFDDKDHLVVTVPKIAGSQPSSRQIQIEGAQHIQQDQQKMMEDTHVQDKDIGGGKQDISSGGVGKHETTGQTGKEGIKTGKEPRTSTV